MFTSKVDALYAIANVGWKVLQPINSALREKVLPAPKWAPGPLLKSGQRRPLELGVPRKTSSLCPDCNREAAEAVLSGENEIADFRDRPGIIDSEILEEGGRILMRKVCDRHGPFEDMLSNHPDFFRRMERLAFGRDFECAHDQDVHNHGPNSIRSGRGSHLIVDLTNRCNMMCSPCFMDANAASYVHELDMGDIKALFDNAVSFKPQREVNVLFSGGEPTLSPIMEVKRQALENIAATGMRTTLQVTVVNGLNNDGLGDIVRFAIENIDKIHGVLFQPVMFTGRDEGISTDDRYVKRYPLSQLAYDLQEQGSTAWRPMRDWFPVSDYGVFAHLCDVLNPNAVLGSLFPDTHPHQGIFSLLLIDSVQKVAVPIPSFFNLEQFMRDIVEITDRGRGPAATKALVSLSVLRNFDQKKAPLGFGLVQLRGLLEDCFYRVAGSSDDWSQKAYSYDARWRVMTVNGLWFQDAFNYDFSAISNSSIPVATQQGEISFCAYNGGGWRKVVEHMNRSATLAEWRRSHPHHEIYAKGKRVELEQPVHNAPTRFVHIDAGPSTVTRAF